MISEVQLTIKKRPISMAVDGLTPLELTTIARHVENKIDDIEKKSNIADSYKLALMAAMELAIELHSLKHRLENNKEADSNKIEEMVTALEDALDKKLF